MGGRLLELGEREFIVRGKGYLRGVADIRDVVLRAENGTAVTIGQVAEVRIGPEIRRGIADVNGEGEVVGGIVVMRSGENAQATIDRVKARIAELGAGLPPGVEVTLDGSRVEVTGPRGTIDLEVPGEISVRRDGDTLIVERPDDERRNRSLHGLARSLVNNMVIGVSEGFTKELQIVGIGYRATAQGDDALELLDGEGVRAGRSTDVDRLADAEHVAAIEDARGVDARDRAMLAQCQFHRFDLGPPALSAGAREDRDLIEDDRRVFDKDTVGHVGQRR